MLRPFVPSGRLIILLFVVLCVSGALGGEFETGEAARKIDALLAADWQRLHLQPNPPAADEVIVRRLSLDIAGRIPTLEETREFVGSKDADKRGKLVDQLLASDGYASAMFNYWADILRLTDNTFGRLSAQAYAEYVKRSLKEDKPYDQFVRELVTTEGGVWDSGTIGFYMRDDNKLDHLAYTVQVFLGTSIICAQCHNHPFDKWTQLDYYGMAAFLYGRGRGTGPLETPAQLEELRKKRISKEDYNMARNSLRETTNRLLYIAIGFTRELPALPQDYRYSDAKPGQRIPTKTMFGREAIPADDLTRTTAFAQWMTSPENPRFSNVIANRLWKKVFGAGLMEPVDELRDSTVASHPALMEYLTRLMIAKKYSLKDYLRVLYKTSTYQRAAGAKELAPGETYHFTGPLLRRMSAEEIWDSLVTLTKGNVDGEISEENEQLHRYLDDLKAVMNAFYGMSIETLIEAAKRNAESSIVVRKNALLAQSLEAVKRGDTEAANNLTREARKLEKQNSDEFADAILGPLVGLERLHRVQKGYIDERMKVAESGSLDLSRRASEVSSPARPGHFLRAFGQSDREDISSARSDATVPQALALLNGAALEKLSSPQSRLSQQLAEAATPREKLETLYAALLSRNPNASESALLDAVMRERGEQGISDVTHALLTGAQFLFVQ
jgi:hypothetical protein